MYTYLDKFFDENQLRDMGLSFLALFNLSLMPKISLGVDYKMTIDGYERYLSGSNHVKLDNNNVLLILHIGHGVNTHILSFLILTRSRDGYKLKHVKLPEINSKPNWIVMNNGYDLEYKDDKVYLKLIFNDVDIERVFSWTITNEEAKFINKIEKSRYH